MIKKYKFAMQNIKFKFNFPNLNSNGEFKNLKLNEIILNMWKYFLFIYCFMKIYQFLTSAFFLLSTI